VGVLLARVRSKGFMDFMTRVSLSWVRAGVGSSVVIIEIRDDMNNDDTTILHREPISHQPLDRAQVCQILLELSPCSSVPRLPKPASLQAWDGIHWRKMKPSAPPVYRNKVPPAYRN
jgi:hypothetical protein